MAETDLNNPNRCWPLSDFGVCSNHAGADNRTAKTTTYPFVFVKRPSWRGGRKDTKRNYSELKYKILIH